MALYTYLCPACGESTEVLRPMAVGPPDEVLCVMHEGGEKVAMARDYQADSPRLGNVSELRNAREAGGLANQAKLFLPDNDEFAGPGDPDGTKGMREWRETHRPKTESGNKKPFWPGTVERKVY